jgi:predicted metal-dependent hydrolase
VGRLPSQIVIAGPSGPIVCRVVAHPRARRLTLRARPGSARLTVPPGTSARSVAAFVDEHRSWIAAAAGPDPRVRPLRTGDVISLLDERLRLRIDPGGGSPRREDGALVTPRDGAGGPDRAVELWYRTRARGHLGRLAVTAAEEAGLRVGSVAIGDQVSRWGSCSARGRLSFSWRLMLAPAPVAAHAVLHEVCHLAVRDHSEAFWTLLRRVDPDTDAHRAWLARHGPLLRLGPAWRALEGAEAP